MRTRAIILKKQGVNEHDQIVTCYCQDRGATRAIARGIMRPKSVQSLHLDALSQVEFELIDGRTYPIIASAHAVHQYPILKSSVKHLAAANFFMEVLDRIMFENEQDEHLWAFLAGLLADLDAAPLARLAVVFKEKQEQLLDVLGYADALNHTEVKNIDTFFEYLAHGPLHSLRFLNAVLK